MQRIAFPKLAGGLLMGLGAVVMIGWLAHVQFMISLVPNIKNHMVFNSALIFFLFGCALLKPKLQLPVGIFVTTIGILTLLQHLFSISFGLDEFFVRAWLKDLNPYPGRMAENSVIAFIFAGLALIALQQKKTKGVMVLLQILIFSVLILGFTALLGYVLQLDVLYSWYQKSCMSFESSIGNILLGLALWTSFRDDPAYSAFYEKNIDNKIILLSGLMVVCVGLLAFMTIYPHHYGNSFEEISKAILPVLLLIVVIAMTLLFWQVIPLVRKVTRSEHALIQANFKLHQAEEELSKLAYQDVLTGVANRYKLEQSLDNLIIDSHRDKTEFAVFFLDLDHFKNVNDTIGHDAGDLLLKIVAKRLKNILREHDIVARLGGDEFVIVIVNAKKTETLAFIANKILNTIVNPIVIKGKEHYITVSLGISVYPNDGVDIQNLMKNADLALYRAKEQGRNNFQFCTPEMTSIAQDRMLRQTAFSQAFAKNEFYLEYQPIVNLQAERITGIEALIRWNSGRYGIVKPSEIISLAEDSGLIVPLTNWIIHTACMQVKQWQDAGFVPINLIINFSLRQFRQINFVDELLQIMTDANYAPRDLEVDITENILMSDPVHSARILKELKNLGVQISIDDFGTGYASLDYLKRFSIDKIKIDRSYVQQIGKDQTAESIISAMISMANKLAIKTLAEGVETEAQFDFLRKEKCTEIQGYVLSTPLSPGSMLTFLQQFTEESTLKETQFVEGGA